MRVLENLRQGARKVAEVLIAIGGQRGGGGEGKSGIECAAGEGFEVEVFVVFACFGGGGGGGVDGGSQVSWEGEEGGESHCDICCQSRPSDGMVDCARDASTLTFSLRSGRRCQDTEAQSEG